MIDKTTVGVTAEPAEVEAVLHNLCGYHLAERDPAHRYAVLTREQVLYDALVASIKRERGRALAELLANGYTLAQIVEMTNVGTRQRAQKLIALAKEGGQAVAQAAVADVQAASREFDERLAAVEATLDEVVGPSADETGELFNAEPFGADNMPPDRVLVDKALSDRAPSGEYAMLEPTQMMPALAAAGQPTRRLPTQESMTEDDTPWWRRRTP